MKKFIYFILFIAVALVSCSTRNEDDLDKIKNYKLEDKYFKASLVNLHFLIETSETDKLDTIFLQVVNSYSLPLDAKNCKDGEYTGSSTYDAFDYRHSAKIIIKNEHIISVDYNEIFKVDGHGKREDKSYCDEMSVSGTTPAIAYPDMERQLISKQNLSKIDAVSGATYSLFRFKYAVMIALAKARLAKKSI